MLDKLKYLVRRIFHNDYPFGFTTYIDELEFDYLKTFSVNRKDQSEQFSIGSRIIDLEGDLHPSSVEVSAFRNSDAESRRITNFFKKKLSGRLGHKCGPIYRDAIAFYQNDHKVVGVIDICFQCQMIANDKGEKITLNSKSYKELREMFSRLGHDIELY